MFAADRSRDVVQVAQCVSTRRVLNRIALTVPADKWITDGEVKKIRAETKYHSGNCALIK